MPAMPADSSDAMTLYEKILTARAYTQTSVELFRVILTEAGISPEVDDMVGELLGMSEIVRDHLDNLIRHHRNRRQMPGLN